MEARTYIRALRRFEEFMKSSRLKSGSSHIWRSVGINCSTNQFCAIFGAHDERMSTTLPETTTDIEDLPLYRAMYGTIVQTQVLKNAKQNRTHSECEVLTPNNFYRHLMTTSSIYFLMKHLIPMIMEKELRIQERERNTCFCSLSP